MSEQATPAADVTLAGDAARAEGQDAAAADGVAESVEATSAPESSAGDAEIDDRMCTQGGRCNSPRDVAAVPSDANVVSGTGVRLARISGRVCLGCGATSDIDGQWQRISADELFTWRKRWDARDAARAAVFAGVPMLAEDTSQMFPDPFWLTPMGLCTLLTSGALLANDDPAKIRERLRAIYGSDASESPVEVSSALGPIVVDRLYFDHLHEIDGQSGVNRLNADHIEFATLTPRTLSDPLEVYEQQPGGNKTRKRIFLALYQVDSAFTYHMAIVTARSRRLLTAYRINGGRSGFLQHRFGVPVHVIY